MPSPGNPYVKTSSASQLVQCVKQRRLMTARRVCRNMQQDTVYRLYLLCGACKVVTQLVEALRYKPEGRGFDSQ